MTKEQTRPTMMSWLKAAALRTRESKVITLDNGKNELDVMMGCATPPEVVNSIFEHAILGQTNKSIRKTYSREFSHAINQIHEKNPQQAQEILEKAKEIGKETPWLWHSATGISHDIN